MYATYTGDDKTAETGQRTVAQRIFYDRFWVLVPEAYYQTKESIEVLGLPDYGDKQLNRAALERPRQLNIPIAGMCIYLEEGAPLTLMDPTDCVTIYKLLVEHLNNWKQVMGIMGGPKPPIEDLRTMDNLAEALYPLVKIYSPQTHRDSIFKDNLAQVGTAKELEALGAPIGRAPKPPPPPPGSDKEKPAEPGYTSIADIVAREAFSKPWIK